MVWPTIAAECYVCEKGKSMKAWRLATRLKVTRRAVETISLATGKPVDAEEVAHQLGISKDQAYNKLRYAVQAGVIRTANKPERSNRKTYCALPARHFVPEPESCFVNFDSRKPSSSYIRSAENGSSIRPKH